MVRKTPACPTMKGRRMKRMTPRMFWTHGWNTPLTVPSFRSDARCLDEKEQRGKSNRNRKQREKEERKKKRRKKRKRQQRQQMKNMLFFAFWCGDMSDLPFCGQFSSGLVPVSTECKILWMLIFLIQSRLASKAQRSLGSGTEISAAGIARGVRSVHKKGPFDSAGSFLARANIKLAKKLIH